MERFSYEGAVNVRPLDRGVMLENTNTDLIAEIQQLVDAPVGSGWEGRLRILIEKIDDNVTE